MFLLLEGLHAEKVAGILLKGVILHVFNSSEETLRLDFSLSKRAY